MPDIRDQPHFSFTHRLASNALLAHKTAVSLGTVQYSASYDAISVCGRARMTADPDAGKARLLPVVRRYQH